MEQKTCNFVEKINGVTFIVNIKSDENAKKPLEQYFEDLITQESLEIEPECA